VNVRLNIWLNETNFERMNTIIGNRYSSKINTANTVFCIFEPNADGLTADSFPTEKSVFYGSRVGGLYPYCISRVHDAGKPDKGHKERIAFIKKRRLKDLGETEVDPALIERILWEGDNGATGSGLAKIMDDLSARFPSKASAQDSLANLPLRTSLTQAINFGAVDSRGVVAIVLPSKGEDTLTPHMSRLLFEEGIAGRVHVARLSQVEWSMAKASGLVGGGTNSSGVFFLYPDSYGRNADVHAEVPATATESEIRRSLTTVLAEFHKEWRKNDYLTHIRKGVMSGINWPEWNPLTREVGVRAVKEDMIKKWSTPPADETATNSKP